MENLHDASASLNSLISREESLYYKQLAQDFAGSPGVLVDGGCFLGDSTIALCEGVRASGARRSIIAIDRFTVHEGYLLDYLAHRGIHIGKRESFLQPFLTRTHDFADILEVRAGELSDVGRISQPISVCIVDIAKSRRANTFVVRNWLPFLIPRKSCLFHQDFYSPYHPWIAASLAPLTKYFACRHARVGDGLSLSLQCQIDDDAVVQSATLPTFSAEGIESLKAVQAWLPEAQRGALELTIAFVLFSLGRHSEALQRIESSTAPPDLFHQQRHARWTSMLRRDLCGQGTAGRAASSHTLTLAEAFGQDLSAIGVQAVAPTVELFLQRLSTDLVLSSIVYVIRYGSTLDLPSHTASDVDLIIATSADIKIQFREVLEGVTFDVNVRYEPYIMSQVKRRRRNNNNYYLDALSNAKLVFEKGKAGTAAQSFASRLWNEGPARLALSDALTMRRRIMASYEGVVRMSNKSRYVSLIKADNLAQRVAYVHLCIDRRWTNSYDRLPSIIDKDALIGPPWKAFMTQRTVHNSDWLPALQLLTNCVVKELDGYICSVTTANS